MNVLIPNEAHELVNFDVTLDLADHIIRLAVGSENAQDAMTNNVVNVHGVTNEGCNDGWFCEQRSNTCSKMEWKKLVSRERCFKQGLWTMKFFLVEILQIIYINDSCEFPTTNSFMF